MLGSQFINLLWLTAAAYLLGSLPFGVWLGRLISGRDVRTGGSGHSGGTNTFRQFGLGPALAVVVLDLGKGAVAGNLALRFGLSPWVAPLATTAVVAGHCWPLFAGFRGGMGLAAAGGAFLVLYPIGFFAGLALAATGSLVLRHSARGNLAAGLAFGPVLWLLSRNIPLSVAAAGAGLTVAVRAASDWRRVYRELWLDRPTGRTP